SSSIPRSTSSFVMAEFAFGYAVAASSALAWSRHLAIGNSQRENAALATPKELAVINNIIIKANNAIMFVLTERNETNVANRGVNTLQRIRRRDTSVGSSKKIAMTIRTMPPTDPNIIKISVFSSNIPETIGAIILKRITAMPANIAARDSVTLVILG